MGKGGNGKMEKMGNVKREKWEKGEMVRTRSE
jgi:hypothetical protein